MKANLFRFVINRPPQRLTEEEIARLSVSTHMQADPNTEFLNDLFRLRSVADREGMRSRSRRFIKDEARNREEFATPINAFDQWLSERQPKVKAKDLMAFAESLLNSSIADFVKSDDYRRDRQHMGDLLLAHIIAGRQEKRIPAHLARLLRVFGLLERLASNGDLPTSEDINNALKAIIVLPRALYPLPPVEDKHADERKRIYEERLEAYKALREDAKNIADNISRHEAAIEEILAAYEVDRRRDRARANENESGALSEESVREESATLSIESEPAPREVASILSPIAVELLSNGTTELLRSLRVNVSRVNVVETVNMLENRVARLARDLNTGSAGDPTFVMIGGILTSADNYVETGGRFELPTGPNPCPTPNDCVEKEPESPIPSDDPLPTGPGDLASIKALTGDLMLVEQTLKRYELGEIAHIENVLLGELKDRTHRRKETTEDTTLFETESIEETERDLQSTERFELQTETSKVISEDTSFETGLTVTGRYGPSVEVSASFRYGRDTSREEANRTATSYSRDVTERAVSRLQDRVFERRISRIVREIEETNFHQLNNVNGEDHIAGIYRWVDKVYQAQVVNYGFRAMFEIVIPEPAAFMKFAMASQNAADIDLKKPTPPGYCLPSTSTFVPLQPHNICRNNYMYWVNRFGATGVKPPPPTFKIVGKSFDNPKLHNRFDTVSDDQIRVPDGYRAQRAWIIDGKVWEQGITPRTLDAYVGRRFTQDEPAHFTKALNNEDGDLPVSLIAVNLLAYVANIEIECRVSEELYEAWQLEVYEAIMVAYQDRLADYEDRLAALEIQQGIVISGNNPSRNKELIRDELKRSSISIITGQHFDDFQALRRGVGEEGYPQLHLPRIAKEGNYIRFFEQAFEWEHISYIFYPYFWGRKQDWVKNMLLDDNDPLFTEFLRAGAARVVVPVRPGFEDAMSSYLTNGLLIADGDDVAIPGDETLDDEDGLPILSLLAEVKARQGYDGTPGQGTIDVTNGSADVVGTETIFSEDNDIGREIHILGVKYSIIAVASETAITLDRPYEGNDRSGIQYALGVQYVGEAWEVRVPTSIVFLENNVSSLPTFD